MKLEIQHHFTYLEYTLESCKANKEVLNLGWLRRNYGLIECFTLEKITDIENYPYIDATLRAYCEPNKRHIRCFVSSFADYSVAENFLKRPIFYGLKLNGKIISKP